MAPLAAVVLFVTSLVSIAMAQLALAPASTAGRGSEKTSGGSWTADWMSSYVGAVPAGSQLREVLQSVSKAGLSSAFAATERAAAALSAGSAAISSHLFKEAAPDSENEAAPEKAPPKTENEAPADKAGPNSETEETAQNKLAMAAFVAASGVAVVSVALTPVMVPVILSTAGFGSTGIAAGSWAAGLMSSYVGGVPAGSLCAVLQSVGMAGGLSTSAIAAAEGAAAALAAGSAAIGSKLFKKAATPDIEHEVTINNENQDKQKSGNLFEDTCPCK